MPTDRTPVRRRPAPAPADGGFSLVEVLVALAVIGTVMAATAPFLVKSVAVVGRQRTEQVAIAVANDALERARALTPSALLTGRPLPAAQAQLAAAPTAAQNAFAGTSLAGDGTSGSGDLAPLPTKPLAVTVSGAEYQQNWYVGRCWQLKATPTQDRVGDCVAAEPTGAGVVAVPFYRVVVAVTWRHNSCVKPVPQPLHPADECVYVASTLVSTGSDPVFDLKRPAPAISGPEDQENYIDDVVGLQLVASYGSLPRSWTITGLPPGLAMSGAGLITGRPTKEGTYPVTVQVQDRDLRADDSTFTWIVARSLALTTPAAQTSRTGTVLTFSIDRTGGLLPLAWSATGLPAGLSIDASTGVISGKPTTTATTTVTVTVVDKRKPPVSVSFPWRVLTPVVLANPGSFNATKGDLGTYNLAPLASGGLTPYTWQAGVLPAGLTLNATTGAVTGTIRSGTRYLASVQVTDAAGGTASVTVLVNVAHRTGSDLRVTAPSPTAPDQSTAVGAAVVLNATAAGAPKYTWSATNLPPGLTVTDAGAIRGKPTVAGTYIVTLTVTDTAMNVAILMFAWKVT